MIKPTAFFRPSFHVVALAMCSLAFAGSAAPAAARSHQEGVRHAHMHPVSHTAMRHVHHHRRLARRARQRSLVRTRSAALSDTASTTSRATTWSSLGPTGAVSNVVAEARRYLGGGNPTGRASLWCARFMNMVLEHTGHRGTGSDMANSFAHYGQRVAGPQVGAIAVMARRGGGHVGVVSGIDAQGNPIVISGNYGNRVREAKISRGRIYAYVMPN
jgi:uncharacterized protein (TIGR02594 family)